MHCPSNRRTDPAPRRRVAPLLIAKRSQPRPSRVYDTFWRFACERQQVFIRRVNGEPAPWTTDPIIASYRFTNVYRASDRVSQYLIRRVIYRADLPDDDANQVFRILLFKLFNRIDTWELLESKLGDLTVESTRRTDLGRVLDRAQASGERLYSAAYIMPSTGVLGERVKHRGHLRLLERLTTSDAIRSIRDSRSMEDLFRTLLAFPTLGPFLAFQFAVDINYSTVTDFSEADFVVPGPGALDGVRKCFESFGDLSEAEIIRWVTERQAEDTRRLGLDLPTLFGRQLQLIDIQNLFCEVSKYARVAHPDVAGVSQRTRIKQTYRCNGQPLRLFFPPKWGINDRLPVQTFAAEHDPAYAASPPLLMV